MRKNIFDKNNSNTSNPKMLLGTLIGVLLYIFTGNIAAVIVGLLIGLVFDKRNREQ